MTRWHRYVVQAPFNNDVLILQFMNYSRFDLTNIFIP